MEFLVIPSVEFPVFPVWNAQYSCTEFPDIPIPIPIHSSISMWNASLFLVWNSCCGVPNVEFPVFPVWNSRCGIPSIPSVEFPVFPVYPRGADPISLCFPSPQKGWSQRPRKGEWDLGHLVGFLWNFGGFSGILGSLEGSSEIWGSLVRFPWNLGFMVGFGGVQ